MSAEKADTSKKGRKALKAEKEKDHKDFTERAKDILKQHREKPTEPAEEETGTSPEEKEEEERLLAEALKVEGEVSKATSSGKACSVCGRPEKKHRAWCTNRELKEGEQLGLTRVQKKDAKKQKEEEKAEKAKVREEKKAAARARWEAMTDEEKEAKRTEDEAKRAAQIKKKPTKEQPEAKADEAKESEDKPAAEETSVAAPAMAPAPKAAAATSTFVPQVRFDPRNPGATAVAVAVPASAAGSEAATRGSAAPAPAPASAAPAPAEPAAPADPNKIYCGGLPFYMTNETIHDYFAHFGEILEVDMMTFGDTGRFRGIALVTFRDLESARKALEFNGDWIDECQLKIAPCDAKHSDKAKSQPANHQGEVQRSEGKNSRTVFVGNLPWDLEEETLRETFKECKVKEIRWGQDKETGNFQGRVWIAFKDDESVEAAIAKNGETVMDRQIKVAYAIERPMSDKEKEHAGLKDKAGQDKGRGRPGGDKKRGRGGGKERGDQANGGKKRGRESGNSGGDAGSEAAKPKGAKKVKTQEQ